MCDDAEKNGVFIIAPECLLDGRHQHHLLCVDDEKMLVLLIAQILATNGYQVTASISPLQALEIFERGHIELAVLDYHMPGMNGACLAAQLKSACSKVKVVLFTGALHIPEPDLSLVDAVVDKLDGMDALLATIHKLLATC